MADTYAIVRGMACLDVQQRRTVLARWAVAISEIDYDLARWTDDLARWQRRRRTVFDEDFEPGVGTATAADFRAAWGHLLARMHTGAPTSDAWANVAAGARAEPVPSSWLFYQHHAHLPAVHRQTCPQADKATARFVTPELARDHVQRGRWIACPRCNPVGTQ